MLRKALADSDTETLILVLKAIGNAGSPASIKEIQKLLPSYSHICSLVEPKVVVTAILALRNVARIAPKEVGSDIFNVLH